MRRALPVLLFACLSLQAADWKALKPQGYVSDFSGVIDQQSKAALETYAAEVERSTGAQMAFVTVKTLDGAPIEDVANDLFHAWGIGQKNKDNGVLFLFATADHRDRLEVGHGLEAILPDSLNGMLLVEARSALRAGQYGTAMLTAAQSIGTIIAKDKGVTIAASLPLPDHRVVERRGTRSIPLPLLIIGALILFFLFTRGGRGGGGNFLTGMLLGNLLGGGGRNYGGGGWGGGFGGGDSGGGGFGGFGGGDSGGGGASSDW